MITCEKAGSSRLQAWATWAFFGRKGGFGTRAVGPFRILNPLVVAFPRGGGQDVLEIRARLAPQGQLHSLPGHAMEAPRIDGTVLYFVNNLKHEDSEEHGRVSMGCVCAVCNHVFATCRSHFLPRIKRPVEEPLASRQQACLSQAKSACELFRMVSLRAAADFSLRGRHGQANCGLPWWRPVTVPRDGRDEEKGFHLRVRLRIKLWFFRGHNVVGLPCDIL